MKTEKFYLVHIVEASQRINAYIFSTTQDAFLKNHMMQDAVIRQLSNVAESATKLSEATKVAHPVVEWQKIRGIRNILMHEYLGTLDLNKLWKTIHEDLPKLVKTSKYILKETYGTEL